MSETTPRPWTMQPLWSYPLPDSHVFINGPDGEAIIQMCGDVNDQAIAIAQLTLRAVNRDHLFGELLAVLKENAVLISDLSDALCSYPDHDTSLAAEAELARRSLSAVLARVAEQEKAS